MVLTQKQKLLKPALMRNSIKIAGIKNFLGVGNFVFYHDWVENKSANCKNKAKAVINWNCSCFKT